jgi:hypothetical protein
MIPKSGNRFSEKIVLKQKAGALSVVIESGSIRLQGASEI